MQLSSFSSPGMALQTALGADGSSIPRLKHVLDIDRATTHCALLHAVQNPAARARSPILNSKRRRDTVTGMFMIASAQSKACAFLAWRGSVLSRRGSVCAGPS